MAAALSAESDAAVRLGTLVMIRWLAAGGQAITLVVVQSALEGGPWIAWPAAVVGASAVFNLWLSVGPGMRRLISADLATAHLGFDLIQLAALMYLTGGLYNPFALFVLAPVMVAAATLSLRRTVVLVGLAIAAVSLLALWHRPLPWPQGELRLPALYLSGTWTALVVGTAFAALYTWRMAEEARRRAAALSAAQMALAQEQQMTAVGALAAAVAHEMSTPLGTIALVAREIADDLPEDSPIAADVRLLISQSDRCRTILSDLGQARRAERDVAVDRVPLGTLIQIIASRHPAAAGIDLVFDDQGETGADPLPPLEPRAEIVHGLGNFIQNAVQFAAATVTIETRWDAASATVRIRDDGPGFPQHVLDHAGEPYLSTRDGDGVHMGLGIFIATTLLARTQAKVRVANHPAGGAMITVTWPRAALEPAATGGRRDTASLLPANR